MSSCCYQEVHNSGAMGAPRGRYGRDELPKAPGTCRIKIQRIEERLNLLQAGLASSPLVRRLNHIDAAFVRMSVAGRHLHYRVLCVCRGASDCHLTITTPLSTSFFVDAQFAATSSLIRVSIAP